MQRQIAKLMTIDCGDTECESCGFSLNGESCSHGWFQINACTWRRIENGQRHQACLDAEKAAQPSSMAEALELVVDELKVENDRLKGVLRDIAYDDEGKPYYCHDCGGSNRALQALEGEE